MSGNSHFSALAKNVDFFQGLAPEDIARIVHKGMTIRVAAGETVFFKGTTGNQLYVILGGKVEIMDGKERIATLGLGDMFGEMALVNAEPRSATAVAVNDSHLFVLSETTFQRLLTKRVAIRILLNIIKVLSHRLREANRKLKELQRDL